MQEAVTAAAAAVCTALQHPQEAHSAPAALQAVLPECVHVGVALTLDGGACRLSSGNLLRPPHQASLMTGPSLASTVCKDRKSKLLRQVAPHGCDTCLARAGRLPSPSPSPPPPLSHREVTPPVCLSSLLPQRLGGCERDRGAVGLRRHCVPAAAGARGARHRRCLLLHRGRPLPRGSHRRLRFSGQH